jgi:hypothetical protein
MEDDGSERWWTRPVVLATALSVGLLLVLSLSERRTGFTVDEGSYAIQAEAIDAGGWEIHWPFRGFDPDARHFPYHGGSVSDSEEFAYVSHPAWPAILSIARGLGGEQVGLRLLSMASVVASAVVGFHLARALGGVRAAPWGFLLVLATPVLANGFMIWAHAASTACAGLAVLAGVRLVQGPRWRGWLGILVAAVAAGVLLRSEGLLFAGAIGVGLVVVAWVRDRSVRSRLLLAAVGTGLAAAAALVVERAWTADILGEEVSSGVSSRAGDSGSWIGGRLSGIGTSVFDGALFSGGVGLLSVVALGAVAVAVVGLVRPGRGAPVEVALVVATVASAVRVVVGLDDPVPGLLTAVPLLLLAVVPIVGPLVGATTGPRERDGASGRQFAAVVIGSFAVAVCATQYDDGGGLQWGGRYLSPLLVPGAALAACALGQDGVRTRVGRGAVVALAVVAGVGGVLITNQVRSDNAEAIGSVAATGQDVVLVEGQQLARLDWASWPERAWLATDDDVPSAIEVLREATVASAVAVLVPVEDLTAAGAIPSGSTAGPVVLFTLDRQGGRAADGLPNVRSQVGTGG